jgi:hypothetical protein
VAGTLPQRTASHTVRQVGCRLLCASSDQSWEGLIARELNGSDALCCRALGYPFMLQLLCSSSCLHLQYLPCTTHLVAKHCQLDYLTDCSSIACWLFPCSPSATALMSFLSHAGFRMAAVYGRQFHKVRAPAVLKIDRRFAAGPAAGCLAALLWTWCCLQKVWCEVWIRFDVCRGAVGSLQRRVY